MLATTPTVWVVDDDEDDQMLIHSAFGKASINVLALNDGDELLPQLELIEFDERPRLILLDINMTRQNGFETLKALRSTPGFADLPVVMLTTSSDAADRKRCLELGADAFLTKPLNYDQLATLTRQLTQTWALS